ncbi:putative holin-like toxin [Veillonella montpellierensis]
MSIYEVISLMIQFADLIVVILK